MAGTRRTALLQLLCWVLTLLSLAALVDGEDYKIAEKHLEGVAVDAFHNKSIITDHHHLEEDLKHHIGSVDLDKVSEEEMEFYYFTLHDFDQNMLLDGLEIMTALRESLEPHIRSRFSEEDLINCTALTDEVLEEDDFDKDGYLSYVEYMHSQK
uniref:EF-hand domain-containing protein n=1 Tax=Latimeria chalumnae TaxID=7897 RepID=H3BDN8_LATCH